MIYFIQDSSSQAIKIGVSKQPLKRLADLQTAHPSQLLLIGVMDGMQQQEKELHRRFTRQRGEWFDPSPDLLAFIRENAVSLAHLSAPSIPDAVAFLSAPVRQPMNLMQRVCEWRDVLVLIIVWIALAGAIVALSYAFVINAAVLWSRDNFDRMIGLSMGVLFLMVRRLHESGRLRW